MSCSRVLLPGERVPAIVYGLARALVMVLLARARRDGVVLAPMHVGCGALRLALPVGARMAYRPVLQRLARGGRQVFRTSSRPTPSRRSPPSTRVPRCPNSGSATAPTRRGSSATSLTQCRSASAPPPSTSAGSSGAGGWAGRLRLRLSPPDG